MTSRIIDEKHIQSVLDRTQGPSEKILSKVFKKALDKNGLSLQDAGFLVNSSGLEAQQRLFRAARQVKNEIYGERLVFFAPLYISDFCVNDCKYCNFHLANKSLKRKRLALKEIGQQTRFLINAGHKRVLLECGEDLKNNNIDYIVKAINKIYSVRTERGNIRRINVNIAAATTVNYRRLKNAHIGTYQLFQETYHRQTYQALHCGPKRDYQRQITAPDRAFRAGLDDLGIGVLFGLYDWRFEVLALISHAQYMEKKFGVGPHTISVPRFRPAETVVYRPAYPVKDKDFLKIIAILRLAVPYTGLIISTRESAEIRKIAFSIGISQSSASSVTSVGGYGKKHKQPQFVILDERPLGEVIKGVLSDRLLPSFCTACYRSGRTGEDFMKFSKPGEIHNFCRPNGLLTFAEYLEDFGKNGIYKKGYGVINHYLNKIDNLQLRKKTQERLAEIKKGARDLYF